MRKQSVALALAACGGLLGLQATASGAGDCPPAGGQQLPFPSPIPNGEFQFVGRGWGHGVGMSQYAARGAALLGCSTPKILTTMFPGTAVDSSIPMPTHLRVGLYPNGPTGSGFSGAVTSLAIENIDDDAEVVKVDGSPVGSIPVGATWRVNRVQNGGFTIDGPASPGGTLGDSGSVVTMALGGNRAIKLPSKGRSYQYGRLEIGTSGSKRAWVAIDFADIEEYLYGLAEMPASWGDDAPAALRAQGIAARGYAVRAHANGLKSNCSCHLYDSTADQVYAGKANEDPRWVAAVDAKAGKVLSYQGQVAQTFYSSSHGGHSESSFFVWGGQVSYLQPVDVSAWEAAGGVPPHHAQWTLSIDATSLGSLFGMAPITEVQLPDPKGAEGRIGEPARGFGGVRLVSGNDVKTVSGNAFRSTMNSWSGSSGYLFRSTLFSLVAPGELSGVPLAGDWDGDGDDDVGWFSQGRVRLRIGDGSVKTFFYGTDGDLPVTGDWNGDGIDTIGVIRDGRWLLRNTNTSGTSHLSFWYGNTTDVALVGDWDGDDIDEPGIRRGQLFALRHELAGGPSDTTFAYGRADDLPITGDFNGDGHDDIGVIRGNAWLLKHTLTGRGADTSFWFARPHDGDLPVTGDWNGDGIDTAGVARNFTTFLLTNTHTGGTPDLTITHTP